MENAQMEKLLDVMIAADSHSDPKERQDNQYKEQQKNPVF